MQHLKILLILFLLPVFCFGQFINHTQVKGFNKARPLHPVIKSWTTGNFRNDAASIIQVRNTDTLFTVWGRFKNGVSDNDSATLYAAFSYDAGQSWSSEIQLLAYTANQKSIPSIYVDGNGLYAILYSEFIGGNTLLKVITSSNLTTWGSPSTVYNPSEYLSNAAHRVLKLSNGTYVYPYSLFVSGDLSSTGSVYTGGLLKSADGITWTDAGVTISSPDGLCGEPGVFEKQGTMYYYWRSKSGKVFYVTTTDLEDFTGFSAVGDIGINAPNSTTSIIYDFPTDLFIAAHNVIWKPYATTTVDVDDRNYMGLSVSKNQVNRWELVANIDYDSTYHFFEPTLAIVNDHVVALYSNEFSDGGTMKSSLLTKTFPVSSVTPQGVTYTQNHRLRILDYPDWTNTGGQVQLKSFMIGLRKYGADSAYYGIWNNRNVGGVGFTPEVNIKSKGTSRGFDTWIDLPTLDAGTEAFFRTYFTRNGVAPDNSYILREDTVLGGAVVYRMKGDGEVYYGDLNDGTGTDKQVLVNNGILKVGTAPGGGGGGTYTEGNGIDITGTTVSLGDFTTNTVIDAGTNYLSYTNLPNLRLSRSGAQNLFMGNLLGSTDDKWWKMAVDGSRNLAFGTMTDGLSGIKDWLTFERASDRIYTGVQYFRHGDGTVTNPYFEFYNPSGSNSGLYWSHGGGAYLGQAQAGDGGILGSVAGDLFFRVASKKVLFSTDGGVTIDGEVSGTGFRMPASRYLSFGSTAGSSGYGIRDNAGTMQYKNNGGGWTDIGTGGGGGGTIESTTSLLKGDGSGNAIAAVAGTDYATASGIHYEQAVKYATTAALAANTYNNGTSGVGATLTGNANGAISIDGSTPSVNDRVLVKNESAQANNGIYTVTTVGDGSNPYVLTRAGDFNQSAEISEGDAVFVTVGSANAGTSWYQQTSGTITVGTTAIVFVQFNNVAGLADPGANGVLVRTATNTTVNRAINGTTNKIVVTDGDGVGGNPTITIGSHVADLSLSSNTFNGSVTASQFNGNLKATTLEWLRTASNGTPPAGSFYMWGYDGANVMRYNNSANTLFELTENSATQTLTNKRVTKRTGTTTSSATPTINTDNVDFYSITAQSGNITSMTSNLTGTPTEGQTLWIALTATSGTPTITWGASFEASTVPLPTGLTTTRQDCLFVWNTVTSKWRIVANQ